MNLKNRLEQCPKPLLDDSLLQTTPLTKNHEEDLFIHQLQTSGWLINSSWNLPMGRVRSQFSDCGTLSSQRLQRNDTGFERCSDDPVCNVSYNAEPPSYVTVFIIIFF